MELGPDQVALALLAAAVATMYVAVVRWSPRTGAIAWLVIIGFVPIWVGAVVGVMWTAATVVGMATVLALLLSRARGLVVGTGDLLLVSCFVLAVAPLLVGALSISAAFGVVTVWVTAFAVGRLLAVRTPERWLASAVAVVFTAVALLAVIEFVTGWHGLSQWGPSNATRAAWGTIQGRGGLERSEGAFGHSIALGCSLAIAAVVTLEARFRPGVRIAMVTAMMAGAMVTISRLGVICCVLGLLLAALFSPSLAVRQVRGPLVMLMVVSGATLVVLTQLVYAQAADELDVSASYRGDLLGLLGELAVFGTSGSLNRAASGKVYFGGFRSIDSQLLLFGLSYGWLTLGLLVVVLLAGAALVLRRRAELATIAVVAQIPALATVALITQYAHVFWFAVGWAVAVQVRPRSTTVEPLVAGGSATRPPTSTAPPPTPVPRAATSAADDAHPQPSREGGQPR